MAKLWQKFNSIFLRPGVMSAVFFCGAALSTLTAIEWVRSGMVKLTSPPPPEWLMLLLPAGLTTFYAGLGCATLLWEGPVYRAGGRLPARSKEEAAVLFHLEPAEEERYHQLVGSSVPIMLMMPIGIIVPALRSGDLGYLVWVAALFLPIPWALYLSTANSRRVVTFLESTSYAQKHRITNLEKPIWRFLWVADYYREVIRELDQSPFESES